MSREGSKKSRPRAPPDWRSTVGQRLREQRLQLGLTQLELAERIGATTRTLIGYEGGTTTIRFEKLMSLAAAGIDVNHLVYGADLAMPVQVNEALWQRIKAWAEETCVDARGRPMHDLERYQIMQRVYRQLAGSKTDAEIEETLSRSDPAGARRA